MNAAKGPAASEDGNGRRPPVQIRALQGLTSQARENLYLRLRAARQRLPNPPRDRAAGLR